jgi:hypothetical protein
MKPFYTGLIVGVLFKEKIVFVLGGILFNGLNVFHKLKKGVVKKEISISNDNQITKVNFICKVKNKDFFNDSFKSNMNNIVMNPHWDFFKENNVIQIELDKEFIKQFNGTSNIDLSFNEIIDLKNKENVNLVTIDLSFFKNLGDVFLYFYYSINNKIFINVYGENDTLSLDDFKIQENTYINTFFNKLVCASLKTNTVKDEYVTKYLKMFFNNKNKLTPEIMFYNYNTIPLNTDDNMIITCILNDSFIKIKSKDLIE